MKQTIEGKRLSRAAGNQVALTNIADRLVLLLGEQAMLTINSEEGIGTSVTITLPKT